MTQPPVSLDEEIRALQGAICFDYQRVVENSGLSGSYFADREPSKTLISKI